MMKFFYSEPLPFRQSMLSFEELVEQRRGDDCLVTEPTWSGNQQAHPFEIEV
jgi:hypothetical protein